MTRDENSYEIFEQIASIVGEDDAFSICEMFAGEQILFPKAILRMKRNYEIRKEFKKGSSYRALSLKYDLTTRQVRTICHPEKGYSEIQMDLFEALS